MVTLSSIAELGLEFRRLGWKKHLGHSGELYAAWSIEHAERLRAVLGQGTWSGTRTVMHLEDRYLCQCSRCGAEWVDGLHASCAARSLLREAVAPAVVDAEARES